MMSHKNKIPVDSQYVGVLWDSKQVQDNRENRGTDIPKKPYFVRSRTFFEHRKTTTAF